MVRNTRNETVQTIAKTTLSETTEITFGTLDGTGIAQNREVTEATWLSLDPANTHTIVPSNAHWPQP